MKKLLSVLLATAMVVTSVVFVMAAGNGVSADFGVQWGFEDIEYTVSLETSVTPVFANTATSTDLFFGTATDTVKVSELVKLPDGADFDVSGVAFEVNGGLTVAASPTDAVSAAQWKLGKGTYTTGEVTAKVTLTGTATKANSENAVGKWAASDFTSNSKAFIGESSVGANVTANVTASVKTLADGSKGADSQNWKLENGKAVLDLPYGAANADVLAKINGAKLTIATATDLSVTKVKVSSDLNKGAVTATLTDTVDLGTATDLFVDGANVATKLYIEVIAGSGNLGGIYGAKLALTFETVDTTPAATVGTTHATSTDTSAPTGTGSAPATTTPPSGTGTTAQPTGTGTQPTGTGTTAPPTGTGTTAQPTGTGTTAQPTGTGTGTQPTGTGTTAPPTGTGTGTNVTTKATTKATTTAATTKPPVTCAICGKSDCNYVAGKFKNSPQGLQVGDVNADGKINIDDAVQVLMYLAKLPTSTLNVDAHTKGAALILEPGEKRTEPTIDDAVKILMYLAKLKTPIKGYTS